ncbi:DNA topoisomerase 3 [Carnobacteriaceae bacterium zg-84]|uniref:DNA topoisomerase 3 n=1 Tax=Granulicatella sp. zg-84 TaxID=2678503 RepID=UPI0013BF1F81|nr:DNA topoisomerase 3 [Granulicatella sp. zg-84]NEW66389.1 DNA topoisomerase III [Granulicatella sp. zg-84]QMI86145.1 DNA topoisomerase 3 [Carnobacteriaceae bacterium zg-84]
MSKTLVLAEKPSVAKDLARVLGATQKQKAYFEGKNYIVTWALGHLMTLKLPEDIDKDWQKWDMATLPMIPKEIGIKPLPKTTHQLKAIKELVQRKDVKDIVIATDAGREGELVARWILAFAKCQKPMYRLWISSQTDKAIKQGFAALKPANEYDALYQSAIARAKADWLVGLNVTRALTVKYEDNLSAGRVQTPTLALVREQEKKIETFVPKTYFVVNVQYKQLKAMFQKQFDTREEAERFMETVKKGVVLEVKEKTHVEKAPLPYDLTELQKEANQRYQFSAKKTLSIVQSLYETHKIVTYPRTDSKYLTTDMQATMKERLQAIAKYDERAKEYINLGGKVIQTAVFQNDKVSDHHALIPTEQMPNLSKLSSDENKIYRFIVERFLGLFAPHHQVKSVSIKVQFNDKQECIFKENSVLVQGWKQQEVSRVSVDVKQGDILYVQTSCEKKVTTPPSALSEGTLLGAMEKHSLGTPATRAEIIEKLIKSDLMERQAVTLRVTPKGKQLLQLVNPSLVTPTLTEQWEKSLEKIAHGKERSDSFLKDIEKSTRHLVEEIKGSEVAYKDFTITSKKCPECQSLLRERNGKDGKRYVCTNAECSYQRRKDPKVSNHRCPQCHKKMEIIDGKNGAFFKCKFCSITEKLESKSQRQQKLSKHEEKRLLQKINAKQETVESPFAVLKQLANDKVE